MTFYDNFDFVNKKQKFALTYSESMLLVWARGTTFQLFGQILYFRIISEPYPVSGRYGINLPSFNVELSVEAVIESHLGAGTFFD